jgi:replicative DNA helicase
VSSNLVKLPVRRPVASELEAKVVGAVLHLSPAHGDLEALGLQPEDFTVELHRHVWTLARARARRKQLVTHDTVASAGLTARLFTDEQTRQLEQLSLANLLSMEGLRLVARDLLVQAHGRRLGVSMAEELQRINAGQFDPEQAAGFLDSLVVQLRRDCSGDRTAGSDAIELLDRWDAVERDGRPTLLPTGIKALDDTIGGLPQKLALVAAGPGVGKTALLDSILHEQLRNDPTLHMGLFGLEDGTDHVARRWMARDLEMLLRDVGNKQRTEAQRAKSEMLASEYFPILDRLHCYDQRKVTPATLFARASQWVAEHQVRYIWIDNFAAIDLRQASGKGGEYFERVTQLSDEAATFCDRTGVGVGLLVHTTEAAEPGKPPLGTAAIQGGKSLGRNSRLVLDLWKKDGRLRCTISKANELAEQGITLELDSIKTAGLIKADGGDRVDLKAERKAEWRRRLEEQDAERERRAADRKAKKAAAQAAATPRPVEPEPQAELPLRGDE